MKWATLVSRSTIIQRKSYPDWVLGNPTTKSIAIVSHFHLGTREGCNNLAGHWFSALTFWQVSQKGNIFGIISLNFVPPVVCFETLAHLISSWVNGISGLVSLLMYLILQLIDVRQTNPSFVPWHVLVIFCKSEWLLFLDIALPFLNLLVF
jgi:hypothetical protein